MSHGHEHKEYKKTFGDIGIRTKGLYVICDGHAPKSGDSPCQQPRSMCAGGSLVGCKTCEHNRFSVQLRLHVGDELVACPQWEHDWDRGERLKPHYVTVRREQCLLIGPYEHCPFCPNGDIRNPAETKPGWWEKKKWGE